MLPMTVVAFICKIWVCQSHRFSIRSHRLRRSKCPGV
ncbi:hypothetical protein CKAH01_18591 [Colletotrichum kahawae]|uniref:Uncharacterized protein n=1 Tax=Colletotrichum kahawae TaxID=34407 RepID=A0AAD9Y6X3_COLKA|nr:hypothetical protein CKAH01_18591 [Colletotrichum kahawae]